ncbi:MAG: hypothetical protein JRF15_09310 [Deltaproteobacteria bacterium]|jgi:hypothetical protein|nr:hypothetical protein [Deltaproteobacteria bacterium]
MQAAEPDRNRRRTGRLFFWLGAVLLVFAVLRSISLEEPEQTGPTDDRVGIRSIKIKTVDDSPANPNEPEAERVDFDLIAGETMSVAARDLPTERPLELNLLLPAAPPSADSLPARIVAMDGGRKLELSDAVVADDRGGARVRIESGWLSPGRYRIEIETGEPAERAVRRYPLEVR